MSRGARRQIPCLLLFLLLIREGQGRNCSSSDPCPADRPRDARGCCYGLQGDRCGYVEGEEDPPGEVCDSVLGYECRGETSRDTQGTCQGLFSLEVSGIEQNRVTLTWNDFLPDEYAHEYSLRWTAHTYKPNISDWIEAGIGNQPRYELGSLRAGTVYFVRVGVWADIERQLYANLTETAAFSTTAVDYCVHDEKEYPVGEPFAHNCEDTCTCMPSGEIECEPLCEIPLLPDPDRCEVQRYNASSCCPLRVLCQPIMADCLDPISESEYEHGEEFETECSFCMCNNGSITCQYTQACDVPEASSCPHPEEFPVPGQCCPQWRCGNETCQDDGETYNTGDTWHKQSTCQTCSCSNGVVTCLDLCEEPVRPENCSDPTLTRLDESCCEVIECRPPEGECFYENKAYSQGSYFTNTQCELCLCAENSTVVCPPKQCRKVSLPKATIFCPHPHIRNDGCCDTLWCEKPDIDDISVIKNLFGHSYSPHSVTLSFEEEEEQPIEQEETQEEEETEEETSWREGETQPTYELQYSSSNNVSANNTGTWQKKTFKPQQVHRQDEPVTSPSHFLQTPGAIRVGKRIFVTVSGMESNTTYYFKVLVISPGLHDGGVGEVTSQPAHYAGAIAVQTLAEETSDPCPSSCESQESMIIPSPSCPRPMLVEEPGTCCPVRKCFPEEGGCFYDNIILQNGEQVREHCDKTCLCRDGNVTCTPVCGQPGPIPREGCALKTLANHCCSLWMCPPRSRKTEAMFVVLSMEFQGECKSNEGNFTTYFKKEVWKVLERAPACYSEEGTIKGGCESAKITVTCPQLRSVYRRRRDVDKIRVDIYLQSNVSSSNANMVGANLVSLADSLTSVFNTTNFNITVDDTVYMRVGQVIATPPTGVCDPGFIFVSDVCVEGVTPSTPPTTLDVPLRVSATSTSALLAWQSLKTPRTHYVTGLQIEYQEEAVVDSFTWNQTDPLDPGVTSHELTSLQAARGYRARLVVFTSILDNRLVRMKPIRFETKPFERTTMSISINLQEVSVSVNSVILRWTKLNDQILREVDHLIVRYSNKGVAVLEDPKENVKTKALIPSSTSVTISQLTESTAYVAHLAFFFKNNTMAKTGSIHFVTMAQGGSTVSLVVALLVSVVVAVCAIAVVLITCCLWRRNRQQEARETAFENKTFGLRIENDGRILRARP